MGHNLFTRRSSPAQWSAEKGSNLRVRFYAFSGSMQGWETDSGIVCGCYGLAELGRVREARPQILVRALLFAAFFEL